MKPEELAAYFMGARRADPDWLGCNVTIPHKVAVMDHVTDPASGGLSWRDEHHRHCETGGPIGTTDAGGFSRRSSAPDLAGNSVCIIGAGGAA